MSDTSAADSSSSGWLVSSAATHSRMSCPTASA
jgi:hypothetical protein